MNSDNPIKSAFERFCEDPSNKDKQDILYAQLVPLIAQVEATLEARDEDGPEIRNAEFIFLLIDHLGLVLLLESKKIAEINDVLDELLSECYQDPRMFREDTVEEVKKISFVWAQVMSLLEQADKLEPLVKQYVNFKNQCTELETYMNMFPKPAENTVDDAQVEDTSLPAVNVTSEFGAAHFYIDQAKSTIKNYITKFYINFQDPREQENLIQLSTAEETRLITKANYAARIMGEEQQPPTPEPALPPRALTIMEKIVTSISNFFSSCSKLLSRAIYREVPVGVAQAIEYQTKPSEEIQNKPSEEIQNYRIKKVHDAASELLDKETVKKATINNPAPAS